VKKQRPWRIFIRAFDRIEDYTLILLLGALLAVATLQIITRNVYGKSLPWGDFAVQYLVVWAGFLGASVAAREKKHIAIDALAMALPAGWRKWIDRITEWFSAFICAVLLYSSIKYLHYEYAEGSRVPGTFPEWALLTIFPVSFGLMTIRFIAHGFRPTETNAKGPDS